MIDIVFLDSFFYEFILYGDLIFLYSSVRYLRIHTKYDDIDDDDNNDTDDDDYDDIDDQRIDDHEI